MAIWRSPCVHCLSVLTSNKSERISLAIWIQIEFWLFFPCCLEFCEWTYPSVLSPASFSTLIRVFSRISWMVGCRRSLRHIRRACVELQPWPPIKKKKRDENEQTVACMAFFSTCDEYESVTKVNVSECDGMQRVTNVTAWRIWPVTLTPDTAEAPNYSWGIFCRIAWRRVIYSWNCKKLAITRKSVPLPERQAWARLVEVDDDHAVIIEFTGCHRSRNKRPPGPTYSLIISTLILGTKNEMNVSSSCKKSAYSVFLFQLSGARSFGASHDQIPHIK